MPKKLLIIALSIYTLTAWANISFAQTSDYDYTKAGVSDQIKQYLCAPSDPNAASTNLTGSQIQYSGANNTASGDLYNCINRLYKFAIVMAAVVGVFFIVIAGYLYMSSAGSQESVDKAKNILETTITSLVILFVGYILLKAINPDLIKFRSIQPPSVVMQAAESPESGEPPAGSIPLAGLITTPLSGSGNGTIDQLQAAGCNITSETRPRNELPNLAAPMWQKLLQICQAASQGGNKPTVSSTVRRESVGSYHQKGCAVDFADGGGNGFFNFNTKTGRPLGVAIYNAAKQAGVSEDRIDPGVDRNQTFHIHVDLGTSCPN